MYKTLYYLGQAPWHTAALSSLLASSLLTQGSAQKTLLTLCFLIFALCFCASWLKMRLPTTTVLQRWEARQTAPENRLRFGFFFSLFILSACLLLLSSVGLFRDALALLENPFSSQPLIWLTQLFLFIATSFILIGRDMLSLRYETFEPLTTLLTYEELGQKITLAKEVYSLGDEAARLVNAHIRPETDWDAVGLVPISILRSSAGPGGRYQGFGVTTTRLIILDQVEVYELTQDRSGWSRGEIGVALKNFRETFSRARKA